MAGISGYGNLYEKFLADVRKTAQKKKQMHQELVELRVLLVLMVRQEQVVLMEYDRKMQMN